MLVIEKAWAKVFGSYQRIEGGSAGEALYPLTGSPQTQFYHDEITDLDGFWERLYASDRKKMPMCCCTYSQADNQVTRRQIQEAGLQDCHAYSLIGAKIVTNADLVEHRLLKIRNPYGMKEWNGDWSDKSRKWTVKTREQVNCEDREDGCFFISLEDFIKFFTRTTICYYVDNYEDNFVVDQHEVGQWAMVKFTLERDNPNPLCLSVDQISERFLDRARDGGYLAPPIRLILTKLQSQIEQQTQEVTFRQCFVNGDAINQESHLTVALIDGLKKGVYVALFQVGFTELNKERKLVFSVYCAQ